MFNLKKTCLTLLTISFAACGGGGGSPAPTPTPASSPTSGGGDSGSSNSLSFTDITAESGISFVHGYNEPDGSDIERFSGGVAAADYDRDGDVDLFIVRGDIGANRLYRNDGNNQFTDVAEAAGLAFTNLPAQNFRLSGPTFADMDGDGDHDLFIGGFRGDPSFIYQNNGDGTYTDVSESSGIRAMQAEHTNSAAFGDYDKDGDLDMFLSHWGVARQADNPGDTEHLWRNVSSSSEIRFENVSVSSRISETIIQPASGVLGNNRDYTFAPTFADMNNDGFPDIVVTGDFETSRVFYNNQDGTFNDVTNTDVIIDESGMGSTVGDYDNDGDLDWFVSSIKSTATDDIIGNRLYRNNKGVFEDATEQTGVDDGSWGWGACFFDAENDADLDIFHVNGWPDENTMTNFEADFSRLFISNGSGVFEDHSDDAGILDPSQGRGVVCADFDNDGDTDLFLTNRESTTSGRLYRNNTQGNNYLSVNLLGNGMNTEAAGARIELEAGSVTQTREIVIGNNFTSQNPTQQVFGLADATQISRLTITWPDGNQQVFENLDVNQSLEYVHPDGGVPIAGPIPTPISSGGEPLPVPAQEPSPLEDTRSPSLARQWNELLLEAIRDDFARPTVHARNLFHSSALSFDLWSAYSDTASAYLVGKTIGDFTCELDNFEMPENINSAREESISFATYRLLAHRFDSSPGRSNTIARADQLMASLGYDTSNISMDYVNGGAAELGNYAADCYIRFGLQDGSNEANDYANEFYQSANPVLEPDNPGNPNIVDLDRWQPLKLVEFIDQSGNPRIQTPDFLSPEWGQVQPFALPDSEKSTFHREGFDYRVYYDPDTPPLLRGSLADEYKWGFALVSIWSSHLDPSDDVMIDISPASLGNISSYPISPAEYPQFYRLLEGGDPSVGYTTNPITNEPYTTQMVPRGDYARVLAEFWADGPDSETPPGHWFVILNEVSDHPELEKRFQGVGDELGPLEWDVKAYFALGGAMHDSAISAWGIKGWYDYIRPVSAIRAMADLGQSSDPGLPSYSVDGIPLKTGFIELVKTGDPLAGDADENVGKIKVMAWKGPDFIVNPNTDQAGVDWILAENWWPYQRPTFVTPPFAGYVSGHSTYSRAAAEVLTALTGSEYFPGGMSEFKIEANNFLVFEEGPSVDMILQWATYRDASDQCSLSRIWGGIHPPADDIPGRLIGEQIGIHAFNRAVDYINGNL